MDIQNDGPCPSCFVKTRATKEDGNAAATFEFDSQSQGARKKCDPGWVGYIV